MQFSMMSSKNLSVIYNLNTSLQMREYPLQYVSTDKNKKSHYNKGSMEDSLTWICTN